MSTNSHHQPLYKLVVTHYVIAGFFFLVLAIMLLFSVESLSGHYFQPKLLALTHTAALGWGSMIIFGALYQLLPVILETRLFSIKLGWWSLAFFTPGVILLICAFWTFDPGICMQIGGLAVLIGVILLNLNIFFTVKHKTQESIFQEFIVTAGLWLFLTALLGVVMVFNFQFAFLNKDHLHFLRLHAHMGIAGWFLMLIIGVSAKLVPMFLIAEYKQTWLLSVAYYVINGTLLLFLVDGYIYGINSHTWMILMLGAGGIGFYLFYLYQCFRRRIRSDVDLPMLKTLFSFVLLLLGILLLPFVLHYHLKDEAFSIKLSTLYGSLIFMGWISLLILGQTFKTLPFIVWVKHYEQLTGKVKTPLPADLVNNWLLYMQTVTFLLFMFSFIAGFFYQSYQLKIIAACSLILTASTYFVHLLFLLFHRTKTEAYDQI